MEENVVFNGPQPQQTPQTPGGQPEGLNPDPAQAVPPAAVGGGSRKKKLIIGGILVFVLIFLIFLFIPKKSEVKNVKLIWWGLWEDRSVVQSIIADFQKEHPNITIEYSKQDPQQYRERLISRLTNNTGVRPDIFRFHNTWLPMLSGTLAPLSLDVITLDEFKKAYYPVMQKDLVLNGAVYGIPLGADTLALFVNTDMFTAAGIQEPNNWREFIIAAKKLTVFDKKTRKIITSGAAFGTYENITHAPDIISLLFMQQGVDMKQFTKSSENVIAALQFYTSFALPGENQVWNDTLDQSWLAFARGNLAMYFGFSWDIFRIQELNNNLQFKIYPVPGQEEGSNTTIASYWAEGVAASSPNKNEAFLFMNHLAKKETAMKFYSNVSKKRAFGEPYARVDLADTLKDNVLVYPFVSQLKNAESSFFASDTYDGENGLNTLANTYLKNTINSVTKNNTSLDSAVKVLNEGVTQVLTQYAQGQ